MTSLNSSFRGLVQSCFQSPRRISTQCTHNLMDKVISDLTLLCAVPKPDTQQAGQAVAASWWGGNEGNICREEEKKAADHAHPTSSHQVETANLRIPRLTLSGVALALPLTPAFLPGFGQLCLVISTSCLHYREAWSCLSVGQPGAASPSQLHPGTFQKLPGRQTPALEWSPKDTAANAGQKNLIFSGCQSRGSTFLMTSALNGNLLKLILFPRSLPQ